MAIAASSAWDRSRIGVAEHRLGGREPDGRIVRPKRERAEQVADGAAQAVVDLDLGERRLRRFAGFGAGQRIGELDRLPGFGADEDGTVGFAEIEVAFGKGGKRPLDRRIAGRSEFTDDRLGRRKTLCRARISR